MIISALTLALRELWANKLRTILTCLGMIIGVSAVIALITIGDGVSASVNNQFKSIGQNLIWITVGGNDQQNTTAPPRPFSWRDVDMVRRTVPGVIHVAPSRGDNKMVKFGAASTRTLIIGSTPDYFIIRLWSIASGRFFSEAESNAGRSVCVIGQEVRQKLFGGMDPVGQRMRVGEIACEVVGLLKPKASSTMGFGNNENDRVIMPLRAYQRRFVGNEDIETIQVAAASKEDVPRVIAGASEMMRQARGIRAGKPDDFSVEDVSSFGKEAGSVLTYVTLFVGAVAFISLIVGGIGIMNIMLVSVTERTREIGIRLAIGAQERDVLTQFLIEAMMLAVIGGVMGILLGLGLASTITSFAGLPFVPSMPLIAAATLFSAVLGIGFGFFPARKAARLNPIEALRFE